MAEIRWTEEAHRWLRDIYGYIALDSTDAARKVVKYLGQSKYSPAYVPTRATCRVRLDDIRQSRIL